MSFQGKLELYYKIMENKGLGKLDYAPLLYRTIWMLGFKVNPPYLAGFKNNFFIQTGHFFVIFAVICLAVFSLAESIGLNEPTLEQMLLFFVKLLVVSSGYGLFVSYRYHKFQKTFDLPSWESLGKN